MPKTRFLVLFLFVFLDRIAKWYILHHPNLYLGDFIELKLFKNEKLFFLSFGKYTNLIVFLVSVFVLFLLISWFLKAVKQKKSFLAFSLFLIILAALSNLFDRLYYGFVIDFIWLKVVPISIFNIADILIFSGIICLMFNLRKYK
ncbi:hypothetical protein AMJ47_01100 [Parcubacteria bacterium DG_72]|nr:MAG: hypothetical protein AMJ47_01100 [Parcubacteria bacterium DG_72]